MILTKIKNILEEDYKGHYKTISQISLDDANNEVLCESDFKGWDFDGVLDQHYTNVGIDHVSSPDLLHFESGKLVFVEFKNGKYDSKQKKNTRLKLTEGPFIGFAELLNSKDISFCIEDLYHIKKEFILVLNQEKRAMTSFGRGMERRVKRSILERYEGIFMNKVHVLEPRAFLDNKVAIWKQN